MKEEQIKFNYSKEELASIERIIENNPKLKSDIEDLRLVYSSAIKEVKTKLEVLGDDFNTKHQYVPIHHIHSRLKNIPSMIEKAVRYGIEDPLNNLDEVRRQIYDIAGIRVVCNYQEDIYTVSDLLQNQSDVTTIKIKDYCMMPKESGYRSLHVVVNVPVYLVKSKSTVPVEIQFRSIAMDTWASLEHELKYKNVGELPAEIQEQLKECAGILATVDSQMQNIRDLVLNKE